MAGRPRDSAADAGSVRPPPSGAARRTTWTLVAGAKFAGVIPAFVLVLAGLAKLHDPFLAGRFLHCTLNLPVSIAFYAARGLGACEVAVGLGVLLKMGRWSWPGLVGLGLYAAFSGLLIRLLLTERSAWTCGCFGDLFSGVGQRHLALQCVFDLVMAGLLAVHVVLSRKAAAARVGGPLTDGGS